MNAGLGNETWAAGATVQRRRWRLLPLVALLALGLAVLGTGSASAATPPAPFKATVTGTLTATSDSTFALAGSGKAGSLGKVTYVGNVQITNVDPVTGVITDTLVETLTLSNGDTLTLLCQQVARPIRPGVYNGRDQWVVIGGTGGLAGATGSGVGETHVDLNRGTFDKSSTGTIAIGS